MALRDVLLGLLVDRPDHGYNLKRRLSPGLPAERLINDGVLYPMLRRMEEEGLVSGRVERRAGRARRRFSATAHGRREFRAWLSSDADEDYEPTYELYLAHPLVKLLFSDHLSQDEVTAKLTRHADGVRERLTTLDRLRAISPPSPDTHNLSSAWLELEIVEQQQRLEGLSALLDHQQTGAAS
jgi:DNA-binding PadR family transcriptional regulator